MTEELFTETIQALQAQSKHDAECSEAFSLILPHDYVSGYDNSRLRDQLIKLLQVAMNDTEPNGLIEFFIYELDFGRKWQPSSLTVNGNNVPLQTPKQLYDLLKNDV